jgi:hypothetical protein
LLIYFSGGNCGVCIPGRFSVYAYSGDCRSHFIDWNFSFHAVFLVSTLNLITLFASVLAIGIVVDDAVVVVEAVHAKNGGNTISESRKNCD